MSGDQTSSSAIIAGYLKFKVLRIKGGKDVGSHSPSTQGPKAWKQYWFEFRVVNNTTKVVEYYDKKDQDKAKGIILLDLVVSVQLLVPHKKQQFMMECSDGQARIFETLTIEEAYAWVTAFNAVLFGKNMRGETRLEYSVALQPSSLLDYCGPCILVINETEVVVYGKDMSDNQVVVTWKLHHLRSFRARKDSFIVRTGSRTTTGSGEFYFSTKEDESVIITYAVEAVLARLKTKLTANGTTTADSISRRSMLPPPNSDDLGIMSPPMDTTQAPSHLDPGLGGGDGSSPTLPTPRPAAYDNVEQEDDYYLRPLTNPQAAVVGPPLSQRSATHEGPAHFFNTRNHSSPAEQQLHLPRSVSSRVQPGHHQSSKHLYDEGDPALQSQAGTTSEPVNGRTSIVNEGMEEGVEFPSPPLPPYDRLNRGVLNNLLTTQGGGDGYSVIQRREEDMIQPHEASPQRTGQEGRSNGMSSPVLHKNFSSNPDIAASDNALKRTALYDTVYESTRSNSSGSMIGYGTKVQLPSKCIRMSSAEDSGETYSVFGQFGSKQTMETYCAIGCNEKRSVVVEPSCTRVVCRNPTTDNDATRCPKDTDTATPEHIGNDRLPLNPPRDWSRDRSVKLPLPEAVALYAVVTEEHLDDPPPDVDLKRLPAQKLCTGDKLPAVKSQVIQQKDSGRDKLAYKQKPAPLPEVVGATYALLTDEQDSQSVTREKSLLSSTDVVLKSLVPPGKDGSREKSSPKGKSNPPPSEIVDVSYELLSDEPGSSHQSATSHKASKPAIDVKAERSLATQKEGSREKPLPKGKSNLPQSSEVVDATYVLLADEQDSQPVQQKSSKPSPIDRQVVAKLERSPGTPQKDGSRDKVSPKGKSDTQGLPEVENGTYALLTDDEPDTNQKFVASRPSADDRQVVAKLERLHKDGCSDKLTPPRGTPESQEAAGATYALLTADESDSSAVKPCSDNKPCSDTKPTTVKSERPVSSKPPKTKPKPPPKPPVFPKPLPLVPKQSMPQKTVSKPAVATRVSASAPNQYERSPPVPKPRPKVVPS